MVIVVDNRCLNVSTNISILLLCSDSVPSSLLLQSLAMLLHVLCQSFRVRPAHMRSICCFCQCWVFPYGQRSGWHGEGLADVFVYAIPFFERLRPCLPVLSQNGVARCSCHTHKPHSVRATIGLQCTKERGSLVHSRQQFRFSLFSSGNLSAKLFAMETPPLAISRKMQCQDCAIFRPISPHLECSLRLSVACLRSTSSEVALANLKIEAISPWSWLVHPPSLHSETPCLPHCGAAPQHCYTGGVQGVLGWGGGGRAR